MLLVSKQYILRIDHLGCSFLVIIEFDFFIGSPTNNSLVPMVPTMYILYKSSITYLAFTDGECPSSDNGFL